MSFSSIRSRITSRAIRGALVALCGACSTTPAAAPVAAAPEPSAPATPSADRCRNAPANACFKPYVGTWSCGSVSFAVNESGAMRISAERLASGCMECSGAYATLADDGSSCAPDGKFVVTGEHATVDWSWCAHGDLAQCAKAPQGRAHVTCQLAKPAL